MNPRKLALFLLLALGVAAFFALGLGRYLSLAALQQGHASLLAQYAAQPLQVAAAYFALYLVVAALSVPGAVVLTLAGGAIFGFGWGLLLVSFASSIGATLAMLAARYLLQTSVEKRLGPQLAAVHEGMATDGAYYLFGLRIIPLVPFFVVNVLMGLTRISAPRFYAVSQLGMLPATAVFVNAGTQLAQLDSLRSVLSPVLLGSLLLLGLFPLLAPHALATLQAAQQRRKLYRPWAGMKPRRFERNLVVIGAGAGGLVSAYIAAAVKAKVTLVEAKAMGGDCLNYGCVPSKALIRSATLAHAMRHAAEYGVDTAQPAINFAAVMARVQRVIAAIAPHDSIERYTGLGVEVLQGHARITSPWTVEIAMKDGSTRSISTRSVVIAAGAQPIVPNIPGLDAVGYLTSDTLWDAFGKLAHIPQRIVLLGGGPIGCELAQAFARLGAQVTVVEMAPRLLLREDADVAALAQAALEADGVRVRTGHSTLRCEMQGSEKTIFLSHQGQELQLVFDALVCAVGRKARLSGYGLEALGIPSDKTIATNEYLQTIYPNIYAAGDVAGPHQLTHAAAHQAWYASVNALFGDYKKFKTDYRAIPSAVYIAPELARVGLNEQEAKAQGVAYEVTQFPLADLDRAIADGQTQGFVKVLTVPGKDRIVGVSIVGSHAAELLAEYVLAMQHGLGLNKLLGTVHSYPTMAEANKYAAGQWKRAHAPDKLLRWVQRFHDWRRG